jgi:hypothetical protein
MASKQRTRSSNTDDACDWIIISGASADTTVKGRPGRLRRVRVWAAGAASSKIELYDGTVAAGTKIDDIPLTSADVTRDLGVYCATSIHAKTTDSGGTARVRVDYM